jgi:hypothetical protein
MTRPPSGPRFRTAVLAALLDAGGRIERDTLRNVANGMFGDTRQINGGGSRRAGSYKLRRVIVALEREGVLARDGGTVVALDAELLAAIKDGEISDIPFD